MLQICHNNFGRLRVDLSFFSGLATRWSSTTRNVEPGGGHDWIPRRLDRRDESWRDLFTGQQEIRDGLIAVANGRKVRVRICDERATLAVKAKTEGLANAEFEYEIPRADAEELMAHHCLRGELAKTRYFVPHGPLTWQVDVYKGMLAGVILAEVELPSEIVEPPIPDWVGREVTGNPDYKKINMVNARMAPTSPSQISSSA
jgi:adenylate cyclase